MSRYLLVDWASLAQQWIQMKETTPGVTPGQQGRPTTCEPNLLGPSQTTDSQNTLNVTTPNKAPGDHSVTGPIIGWCKN